MDRHQAFFGVPLRQSEPLSQMAPYTIYSALLLTKALAKSSALCTVGNRVPSLDVALGLLQIPFCYTKAIVFEGPGPVSDT